MEEVKVRITCINHASQNRTGLPAPIVREFLYQQVRFLCEIIALSCLVAHGDIAALKSHKIGRSYSADEILDRISHLRPHFFPVAVREVSVNKISGGRQHHQIERVEPPPMTKEELLALYGRTHKHLHRGSLKKLLSAATPLDMTINMPEILNPAQKICDLLSHHYIFLSEKQMIGCLLASAQQNNAVQVLTLDVQGGPLLPPPASRVA